MQNPSHVLLAHVHDIEQLGFVRKGHEPHGRGDFAIGQLQIVEAGRGVPRTFVQDEDPRVATLATGRALRVDPLAADDTGVAVTRQPRLLRGVGHLALGDLHLR